jgi:hypothetical protein
MGRIKGKKDGEGRTTWSSQYMRDRKLKMERIRDGLQKPDEYAMSVKEACEKAGICGLSKEIHCENR